MIVEQRKLVWFSCGAASAVAAKLACDKYGAGVEVVHCDTLKDEHPDNLRFMAEVSRWIGQPIKTLSSPKFESVVAVFDNRQYMSGVRGAPCTTELKKKVRFAYQRADDIHIFGMTLDEIRRIREFERSNPELFLEWVLLDAGLSKEDCFQIIRDAGITLPTMYLLGFANNNCIGCVKSSSPKYWNLVRRLFPTVFKSRAEQSRRIGCKLVRFKGVRIYLDELPLEAEEEVVEDLSCGPQCRGESISDDLTDIMGIL